MTSINPLTRYFRQPTIFLRLPSNGQHYGSNDLDMPENGELPVYPMTVRDEILNKTPDALFNGSSVISLIQSCIPNVKNAWAVPSIDLDAMLIAIKIATYGKDIDVTGSCTHCQETSEYVIDLNHQLAMIGRSEYQKSTTIGNFEIMFRPLTYKEINETNQDHFNEQKLAEIMPTADLTNADRLQQINDLILKVTEGTIKALSRSIGSIRTDDVIVNDESQIMEFLTNCSSQIFNAIKDAAIAKRSASNLKPLKLTCSHCAKDYEQPLVLDLSNFFGRSS
jgi:hypothetical protein